MATWMTDRHGAWQHQVTGHNRSKFTLTFPVLRLNWGCLRSTCASTSPDVCYLAPAKAICRSPNPPRGPPWPRSALGSFWTETSSNLSDSAWSTRCWNPPQGPPSGTDSPLNSAPRPVSLHHRDNRRRLATCPCPWLLAAPDADCATWSAWRTSSRPLRVKDNGLPRCTGWVVSSPRREGVLRAATRGTSDAASWATAARMIVSRSITLVYVEAIACPLTSVPSRCDHRLCRYFSACETLAACCNVHPGSPPRCRHRNELSWDCSESSPLPRHNPAWNVVTRTISRIC